MAGSKLLIVEDDQTLLDALRYNLAKEGYDVLTAIDGAQAVGFARKERPDLIILDVMLPGLDGFEVCRILRKEGMTMPILMLTAKAEEIDRVVGLELGADDYMTKPFSLRELLARVRAMLRRVAMMQREASPNQGVTSSIKVGGLEIDLSRHLVSLGGSVLDLSPKEFDLLAFLVRNKGQVFSRDQLLERVWGYDYGGDTRTVDVHIRWLRRKLETDPGNPQLLLTVRGAGYKFEG